MGRCSYTWIGWDEEKDEITRRQCLKNTWKNSDEYCIFHDPSPDKDVDLFKKKLDEQMQSESEEHNFIGYYFPENWGYFREKEFKIKTNFLGATFRNTNFREAIFQTAYFIGATFQNADFKRATFQGTANFSGATFQGTANFWGANIRDADFEGATFQGTAFFTGTTFHSTNFLGATFQGNADFGEASFQSADFKWAKFQDTCFLGATFQGDADFEEVTFLDNGDFRGVTLQNADFKRATFQNADFNRATFQGDADFEEVTFQGDADFEEVTFQGDADFEEVTFQDGNFKRAEFQDATFERATFRDIDLKEAIFQSANFREATFHKKAELTFKYIKKLDLRYAEFLSKSRITTDLTKTLFHRCFTENIFFIDFKRPDSHKIYEEKHKDNEDIDLSFNQLEAIYRDLKQNMQNHGDYSTAGEFYYREMEMRRKGTSWKKFSRLWLEFYRILAGYGERPQNTFLVSISTILFFATLYWRFNCLQYSVKNPCLYQQVKDAVYFSFVTFTTLGLGDIHPLRDWGKALICIEAVIGAFLIALFVVVFVKKMAR